jgi:hypothetical protein
MTVALVNGGIRANAVEIPFSGDVVKPNAVGALNDEIERMIVVGSIAIFQLDEFVCCRPERVEGLNIVHDFPCAPRVFTLAKGTAGARTPAFQEHLRI